MQQRPEQPADVLVLSPKPDAPSFRHRLVPVLPELEARGLAPRVERFAGPPLLRLLARRRDLGTAAVVVLAKCKLSPPESTLLPSICRRIVYDVDDAVYAVRPRTAGHRPRRAWRRQWRFASICRAADLVLACNRTLAAEAGRHARRVEIVPTPVDLRQYPVEPPDHPPGRTLVWIGLPENLRYLELVRPVLGRLARELGGLVLRVICSEAPAWPEVPVELVPWSEATEVASMRAADVGLMPLFDDEWSAGKCAFKLLQYMAAGLPCVASRVAMNCEVVDDGVNGHLAASEAEWEAALRSLLTADDRGRSLGAAGRRLVAERFDTRLVAPRTAELIASVC